MLDSRKPENEFIIINKKSDFLLRSIARHIKHLPAVEVKQCPSGLYMHCRYSVR